MFALRVGGRLLAAAATFAALTAGTAGAAPPVAVPGTYHCRPAPPAAADHRPATVPGAVAPCAAGQVPQPVERHVSKEPPPAAIGPSVGPEDVVATAARAAPKARRHHAHTAVVENAPGVYYAYAGKIQGDAGGSGTSMSVTEYNPFLSSFDSHTVAQLATERTNAAGGVLDDVELGWHVDQSVNGDSATHLFVYRFAGGQGTCYNGCGYVQDSPYIFPGIQIAGTGSLVPYKAVLQNGNWNLYVNSGLMGHFPASLWTPSLTSIDTNQWYGEVASRVLPAYGGFCSDMGNSQLATTSSGAAHIDNPVSIGGTPQPRGQNITDYNQYNYATTDGSTGSFRFGGPGYC
jgi:hypothetical protein